LALKKTEHFAKVSKEGLSGICSELSSGRLSPVLIFISSFHVIHKKNSRPNSSIADDLFLVGEALNIFTSLFLQ
jgi:hypothetical protein